MAYCTLDEVKTDAKITASGDDALITDLIGRAQAWIDRYTQQTFEISGDTSRTFDAVDDVDGNELQLHGWIVSVTSITNGDGETVASSQYTLEPRRGSKFYKIRLKDNTSVSWTYDSTPEDAITVTGKWGYSETPPDDVVHACIRLTIWLYRQRDSQKDVATSIVSKTGAVMIPDRMPRDVAAILKPYKRVVGW